MFKNFDQHRWAMNLEPFQRNKCRFCLCQIFKRCLMFFRTKPSKIDIGIFTVIPSTGIIHPKETVTINIICNVSKFGLVEETAKLFISECPMSNKKGTSLNLLVTGAVPNVNFSPVDNIFMEQYNVNSFTDMSLLDHVRIFVVVINHSNLYTGSFL